MSPRSWRPLFGMGLLAVLNGCGGDERFPMRAPLWHDPDERPFSNECKPDEKGEPSCMPEPYVSPLVWDGADNSVFRPLSHVFKVETEEPAPNVNAFDEVPDSAWFTNRLGKRKLEHAELLAGACRPEDQLDGALATPQSWVIDQGKPNGASPGFRIKVDGKHKFLLKTDTLLQPERPTAASAMARRCTTPRGSSRRVSRSSTSTRTTSRSSLG